MDKLIVISIGLIIGSFLNNVISYLSGFSKFDFKRSKCLCGEKNLSFIELVPLFSYLIHKGRCSTCMRKIPLRYFFVELISLLLFYACYKSFDYKFHFLLYAILTLSLLIIGIVDYYKLVIPNSMVLLIITVSVAKIIFENNFTLTVFITPFFMIFFFSLINIIYLKTKGGRAIGFGDIKLLSSIGLFFSPVISLLGIWLSSLIAIPGFYLIKAFNNKQNKYIYKVPYGFFISLTFILIVFFQNDINNYFKFLFKGF